MLEKDRSVPEWECRFCNISNDRPFCACCGWHKRSVAKYHIMKNSAGLFAAITLVLLWIAFLIKVF